MKSLLDTDIALFLYNLLSLCAEAKVDKFFAQPFRLPFSYEVEIAGDGIASATAISLVADNTTYL